MDGSEIVKHIPEIARGAGAVAAAIPFTGIVKRMLGPAADELAEMWRDQVRIYRYERQLKCVEKAERMAQDAGFTPQAVPPKILFPLLEGASFEDNEDLHTMWAALLANAASSAETKRVRPGFIATLRQLAPDEAAILNWIYDHTTRDGRYIGEPVSQSQLREAYASLGFGESSMWPDVSTGVLDVNQAELNPCLDSLEVARLIERPTKRYSLTYRGYHFVEACRAPKSQS